MASKRIGNRITALIAALFVVGGAALTYDSFDLLKGDAADVMSEAEYIDSACGDGEFEMMTAARAETLPENEGIVIRNGDTASNRLTLTCNVDWGEDIIPDMLSVFRDKNVKITFFVTGGWADKNPEMLRKMYAEGHEIQSHGYSHKLCSQVSEETVRNEISKTQEKIRDILGINVDCFAPPSGDYDDKTIAICREMGYHMCLWTLDTIDWRDGSTAPIITERILSKDLSGSIVLMHPKQATLEALPGMIDSIRERGIEIVPLNQMLSLNA